MSELLYAINFINNLFTTCKVNKKSAHDLMITLKKCVESRERILC